MPETLFTTPHHRIVPIFPLRISSITCIHHHSHLSLSVHRPSSAFLASISFYLPGCYSYVIWFTPRSFLFSRVLSRSATFVLRSPHPTVGLKSILIAYEWSTSRSSRSTHSFPSVSTTLSRLSPVSIIHSLLFFSPSLRCVSQQTFSLIVFGAFGRMCNNYHRARKRATGTLKNASVIQQGRDDGANGYLKCLGQEGGHDVTLVRSTSKNVSDSVATSPPTPLIPSKISLRRGSGRPSADRAYTSRPAGVNNVFSKKVTAQW